MVAKILLDLPVLSILVSLFCGLLYSWLLYRRDNTQYMYTWLKPALGAARFVIIFLLVWLLFSPAIRRKKTEIQKPLLVFLQDNSSSLAQKMSPAELDQHWNKLNSISKELAKDFDVRSYCFSETLTDWGKPAYTGKETDINAALNEISERHSGQSIGAIVIASDGIYNKGNSPLYHSLLKSAPVYTIAMGDTTPVKDAKIAALRYNQLIRSGDQLVMQVEVAAYGMQGQNIQLETIGPDGFRNVQPLSVDQRDYNWRGEVNVGVLKPGIRKISVRLTNIQQDQIAANNEDVAYVEVLDGREKVLLLYESPHPDIKAIRAVAEQNANLTFDAFQINSFRQNLQDYSLVILHGLPSANGLGTLSATLQASSVPQWYIVSAQTDLAKLNNVQQLVKILSGKPMMQEVHAVLNPGFSKFSIPPALLPQIAELPPLIAPVATYTNKNLQDAIFLQKIGNVETDFPLLVMGESGIKKTAILTAEGLWRWRMYDYLLHNDQSSFDALFGKIIQYLTVKEDKRPFRLKLAKSIFAENQPVVFDAELYNESYELVNDPDVSLEIKSSEGKAYQFTMDKSVNAYTLSAGVFGVGDYTATAKTSRNGKAYTSSLSFSVKPLFIESLRLEADHKLLSSISRESGGTMFFSGQTEGLVDSLRQEDHMRPVLYDRLTTRTLLDFRWILALLVALLSLEWFARKISGGY